MDVKARVEIDIIILSYAQSDELRQVTENGIRSLVESEDPAKIQFNILVLESEKLLAPFQYEHSRTIYPGEAFGYHKFMNIGIRQTHAPYICLCNNDLIFHKGWATAILEPFTEYTDVSSASPVCSIHHPKMGFELYSGYRLGYKIREQIAGWCLFLKRELLQSIGSLDPNFNFWCADNDYANTLWMLNFTHILVTSSIVDHLENTTLHKQSAEKQLELTEKESVYYDKKWFPKMGEGWTEV